MCRGKREGKNEVKRLFFTIEWDPKGSNEVATKILQRLKIALPETQTNLQRPQRNIAYAINRNTKSEQCKVSNVLVLVTTKSKSC